MKADMASDKPTDGQPRLILFKLAEPAKVAQKTRISFFGELAQLQSIGSNMACAEAADMVKRERPGSDPMWSAEYTMRWITNWRAKFSAGVSTATGLSAMTAGFISSLLKAHTIPGTVVLIGGGSLIVSATAIAIALFAHGNLKAYERAATARHTASAGAKAIAAQAAAAPPSDDSSRPLSTPFQIMLALAAFPKTVAVTTKGHPESRAVTGIRRDFDEGLQLQISHQDWIPISMVESWSSRP